jgi:hypothetical protein
VATYMPRSAWTSTKPAGVNLPASNVTRLNVHYPASGNVVMAGFTAAQVASRLRGWRDYHVNVRGWADIGYNMAIDGAGRIWTLRGIDRVGAHSASAGNPSENRYSIGVLFVVGNTERPTKAAIEAFRQLRADILKRSPKATIVRGHQQVPGASTACPGGPLMDLIRDGVLVGAPPNEPTPPDTGTPEQEWSDVASEEQFIAAVRKAFHGLLDEAANRSTPTGRQVADDLNSILQGNLRVGLHALLDEAANGTTPTGRQVRDDLRSIVGSV